MDKTKLIENAQKLLAAREQSLRDTLEEIGLLEAIPTPSPAILAAIASARLKRDRQNTSVLATHGLIDALQGVTPKKVK